MLFGTQYVKPGTADSDGLSIEVKVKMFSCKEKRVCSDNCNQKTSFN